MESHAFAAIPYANDGSGYSVIVSNAGDWTNHFINSLHRSGKLWMRGVPTIGVIRVALLFKPLVVVATGSGIGPCLSFLQTHPTWPVRVVWSARNPKVTYGVRIIDTVLKADKDAVIIDTRKTGHPDLAAVVYSQYKVRRSNSLLSKTA